MLTARVPDGRLIVDEPTTLPEGEVVQLKIDSYGTAGDGFEVGYA